MIRTLRTRPSCRTVSGLLKNWDRHLAVCRFLGFPMGGSEPVPFFNRLLATASSGYSSVTQPSLAVYPTGSGTNTNSGSIDEEKGGVLSVAGNLTNTGTITTNGANQDGGANTLAVTGTLTNTGGHSVTIGANNDTADTATVGLLANSGSVTVDKGATLNLTGAGADSNTSAILVSGGTLDVKAGSFTNSGQFDLEEGAILRSPAA